MDQLGNISVQYVKGVGPAKRKLFANLGVESISDLFYLFPRRYEDRRHMTAIRDVKVGDFVTVCGKVVTQNARRSWYTRKAVFETVVADKTGKITCVWFNQPYLVHYFKAGRIVVMYGKVSLYRDRLQIVSPEYEIIEGNDATLNMDRIVPIYPLTRGMSQRYLRKVMSSALDAYGSRLTDILPVGLRNKHRLLNIQHSIQGLHFPESFDYQVESFRRVSFEEFFLFQISAALRRQAIRRRDGYAHLMGEKDFQDYRKIFSFKLTGAQERVIEEIAGDMKKPVPMLRLVQGDVGCGKTIVALFGCVASARNGYQSAIMAPTEILAQQHYSKIRDFAGALRHQGTKTLGEKEAKRQVKSSGHQVTELPVNPVLLIGSMKKSDKEKALEDIRSGEANCIIGTHALLSESVVFKNLSYVVVDEQHKFGVRQRALISAKGKNPDVLVMTATPIPRTLSLTLFGDLDVSVIDEMPPGRGKIETFVYSFDSQECVYEKVRQALNAGQQAYVVYPLVDESDSLELKAAEKMYKEFMQKDFKDFRIGLIHGQMKKAESDSVMAAFKSHDIDLLVATTVLEVGVDVPNANVMVIEHAERFGLSQLHQLRGRIGRGSEDAQCFLLSDPTTTEGISRLDAIVSTTDGFEIAQKDLEIRGPGYYFGRHQHGMGELRFVNPVRQVDILELARAEAQDLLKSDEHLNDPHNSVLKKEICQRYPGYLTDIDAA